MTPTQSAALTAIESAVAVLRASLDLVAHGHVRT